MRFIVPLFATLVAASALPVEDRSDIPSDPNSDMWRARMIFNRGLLGGLDRQAKGQNVVVSPFGIHSLLSSIAAGAEGETYTQLYKALGFETTKLDRQGILDVYQETLKNVTELQHLGLDFANLLVVDEKLELQSEFQKDMNVKFRSGLLKENFKENAEKATNDINAFVDEVTKGKIHKLLDSPLKKETAAVLVNALHLKSAWRSPFNKANSHEGDFNLYNGTTKKVTYMSLGADHLPGSRWSQNFGFENMQIPLDNEGRLWFGIMLPQSNGPDFSCCTPFTSFIHGARPTRINLTFPKFDISQTHKGLVDILKGLGATNLFDADSADLSRIDGKKDLFVSDIAHKAVVTVEEGGVEAAAAAAAVVHFHTTSVHQPQPAINFVVDRPFIFSISDSVTGVDFFTGLVYNP